MKKIKRVVPIILVACMLFIASCNKPSADPAVSDNTQQTAAQQSPAQQSPAPPPPPAPATTGIIEASVPEENANLADHINLIMDTQLTVFNLTMPAGSGNPNAWAHNLVHDRLVSQESPGVLAPELALRWETDDYKTFRFYLREDAYFDNGDPFTAEDVVFTANIGKEFVGSPAQVRWRSVDKITAIDKYVVEMVLNEVYTDFLFDLTSYTASILNERSYNENPDDPSWAWVGTGPYRVVDFATNDFITLERVEDWREGPALTRSITFWTIPEMATRAVMLQNGQAQLSFSMTPEDLDMFNADPDFQVFIVQNNPPVVLGFNNQGDAIMMDLNFRKAVAHALNTDDISLVANGAWGIPPPDGNVWGLIAQYRLEGLPRYEYDPVKAKEYLDLSVYNGEVLEIMTTQPANIRAAELIQLQLADIGVDVKVEIMDQAAFVGAHTFDPESTRQMHIFTGGPGVMALYNFNLHYYPGSQTNRINYSDPYITKLIDDLAAETDEDTRREMTYEAQRYFWETLPSIPLWFSLYGRPAVNGLGGIKFNPDSFANNLRGIYWDLDETPAHLRP